MTAIPNKRFDIIEISALGLTITYQNATLDIALSDFRRYHKDEEILTMNCRPFNDGDYENNLRRTPGDTCEYSDSIQNPHFTA